MEMLLILVQTAIVCSMVFLIVLVVVLSLPKSRMRDVMKFGMLAIGCFMYCALPFDAVPEIFVGPVGFADDFAIFVVGWNAAKAAMKAAKSNA